MNSLSFPRQVWQLAADIGRHYRWRIPMLVLLTTAVALSEGLGMILLLPLLNAVGISGQAGSGLLGGAIAGILAASGAGESVYHLALLVLTVFAVQLLLFLGQTWWVSRLQRDYGAHWQRHLFSVLLRARWSFISNLKLGAMTNQIAQETIRLSGAFLILAQLAAVVVTAGVYLLVACLISWQVTLLMVGFAALIFLVVRGIGRRNYHIGLRLGPLAAELNVMLTEFLGGIKLIKATATEGVAEQRVARVVDELCIQHTWATFLPALVRAIFEFAAISGLCFLLVFGYRNLDIPAASMLLVLALFIRLLPRFNALQQNMQLLATYVPAFFDAQRLAGSAAAAAEEAIVPPHAAGASTMMSGPLAIAIVAGGYDGVTILRDIKLLFPRVGVVGIVGESGAGKSTLVNCLFGLAETQHGEITFGGCEMRSLPLSLWRRQFGYVPQETVLFHQSIRDNIAWGNPSADDQAVEEAARQALAHDFIMQQPSGYATVIGDQGARLSGGQRQRLGIARVLLGRPRLLVMDEATSALDSTSEAAVLETVDRLRRNICVVMVAHRLATVRKADMIVVLSQGRVVETGSWPALMAKQGAFYGLAQAQHIK
jgi:ATP-binding cassette subfamily C protein